MLATDIVATVNFASGWDASIEDFLKIGELATNMARLFNLHEGFAPADDTLPERLISPLENGSLKGICISKDDFRRALKTLYMLKSWDSITGIPKPEKLRDLNLSWAVEN